MSDHGYLFKRGNTYYGRIRLAGRELVRSLRTGNEKEARKKLKAWSAKLERVLLSDSDCPTLRAVTVRWAQEMLPKSVKPTVQQRYLCSMGQVVGTLGDMKIDTITVATLAEYVSLRSRTATNATIRRDLTALSRLM